jgi:hypothetical protein
LRAVALAHARQVLVEGHVELLCSCRGRRGT